MRIESVYVKLKKTMLTDGAPSQLIYLALTLLISFSVFSTSFLNIDFFWDDERFIFSNSNFLDAPSWLSFWDNKTEFFKTWPLGYSIFWVLLKYVTGPNIIFFKTLNILVHGFNAFLLYRVFKIAKFPSPYFLSLLFLIHPLHIETVSWIFQFTVLIAFLFFMLSILEISRYLKSGKSLYLVLAFLFFTLSLYAKTIALFSPFLFTFLFWLFNQPRKKYLFLLPFFLMSFYMGVSTLQGFNFYNRHSSIQNDVSNKVSVITEDPTKKGPTPQPTVTKINDSKDFDALVYDLNFKEAVIKGEQFERWIIFSNGTWHYFSKLFLPLDLSFIYPKEKKFFIFPLLSLIALIVIPWILYKRSSSKSYLLIPVIFFVCLIPVLGLAPVHFFYWSWFSDRYTYFLIILLPVIIGLLLKKRHDKTVYVLTHLYLVLLIILNFNYSLIFNNPTELYKSVLRNSSHPIFYSLLIDHLIKIRRINEAVFFLNEGRRIYPSNDMLEIYEVRLQNWNKTRTR